MSQMGQPFWNEGLVYARKALSLGIPQVAAYYFGNLISDPNYRNQVPDLIKDAISSGFSIDPLPNAPGALQQGDPATAVALVHAAAVPRPFPGAWQSLLAEAQSDLEVVRTSASDIAERRQAAIESIAASEEAIATREREIDQRAHSLVELIERLTNAQATSYFEQEASQYGGEAKVLWRSGLGVVLLAAAAAVAPLAMYYIDRLRDVTPWLEGRELTAAHVTAALALGAVAGVLLARARGRDRARQRARDLEVALNTMFVYAEQIDGDEQRQTFVREMGLSVLQAFLRQDAPAIDADRTLLSALRRG